MSIEAIPEKTCNQWLKEMKAAGFYGKFIASSDGVVIRGEIKKSGEFTTQQQTSANESRQAIKQMLKSKAT